MLLQYLINMLHKDYICILALLLNGSMGRPFTSKSFHITSQIITVNTFSLVEFSVMISMFRERASKITLHLFVYYFIQIKVYQIAFHNTFPKWLYKTLQTPCEQAKTECAKENSS